MTSNAENSFATAEQLTDPTQWENTASLEQQISGQKKASQAARLLRNTSLKNWDTSKVDIQLTPVSCIDVYRELVIQKKSLRLQPDQSELDQPAEIGAAPPSALTTRHPAKKLALRCRKMQMETSDDNPIKYTLYIAAGFAVTTAADGEKQRAPILLIPVSIGRIRGRGSDYTITYTGESLRLNPTIAESCTSHTDQLIKPFDKAADMRDYLRGMSRRLHKTLQCRISANTGLFTLQAEVLTDITASDQINIELERTRPGMEFKPLPPTPEKFNAQLAMRILRFIDQDELSNALQTFAGKTTQTENTAVLDYDLEVKDQTRTKTMKCAQWLCEIGLGHWRLDSLSKLPRRIEQISTDIQTLVEQEAFTRHIGTDNCTIGLLQNLYRAQNRISNAPPEMHHHAISTHADPDTRLLLQKAKIQAASIEHEMASLCETFHMSAVPDSTALHRLIKVISKREESSQLANPQYFRARRQLNEILKTHNGLVTDNDLKKLDALAKTLRFAELFEQDPYYRRCFGTLFHGVETNWQRLDSVINFARNLSYDLESSALVGRLAEHWPAFQRDFTALQETLRPAATSSHKLCTLIPIFVNPHTNLQHAISTSRKFHDKVNKWQKYLRKYIVDTSRTPYSILQPTQYADVQSTQNIAFSEQEYDDRIYHHIVGVGLSQESIAATAEWLINAVERLEIDLPTLRRYLDGESNFDINPSSIGF